MFTKRTTFFSSETDNIQCEKYKALFSFALSPQGDFCAFVDPSSNALIVFPVGQYETAKKQYSLNELADNRYESEKNNGTSDSEAFRSPETWKVKKIVWDYNHRILVETSLYESSKVWHLDQQTATWICLSSPGDNTCTVIEKISIHFSDHIILSNAYNPYEPTVETRLELYDFQKNSSEIIETIKGKVKKFYIDEHFKLRMIEKRENLSEGIKIEILGKSKEGVESVFTETIYWDDLSSDGAFHVFPIDGFSEDYEEAYFRDERKVNFEQLYSLNLTDKKAQLLQALPDANIRGILLDNAQHHCGQVVGLFSEVDKPTLHILDSHSKWAKIAPYFNRIQWDIPLMRNIMSDFTLLSNVTPDLSFLIIPSETDPCHIEIHNIETGKVVDSFQIKKPQVKLWDNYAYMQPRVFYSRDGLKLNSYITFPSGFKQGEACPFVVHVHGGPYARDRQDYNPMVQFLANRGIGSVLVNFRGSTGFGKAFSEAAFGEWSGKMIDDLEDVVFALRDEKIMDERVIITGYSYGGSAVYSALAFKPDLFLGGIAGAGASDFIWETQEATGWLRILMGGDPNTVEGRAILKRNSPYFSAHHIKKPLLIISGADDTTVSYHHSHIMAERLEELGKIVTEIKVEHQGHESMGEPKTCLTQYAIWEAFFKQWLGTSAEPFGSVLRENPDFKVVRGARYIPALEEQLAVDKAFLEEKMPLETKQLSESLTFQKSKQELGIIVFKLMRSLSGRQLLEELYAAAEQADLIRESIWKMNKDGKTFCPIAIFLKRGITEDSLIQFSLNHMLSKPQYCALLTGQKKPELTYEPDNIRGRAVLMLNQFKIQPQHREPSKQIQELEALPPLKKGAP